MNKVSLLTTILLCCVLLTYRLWRSDLNHKPLKLTTYDAFGYYMYLPKLLIYKDVQLNWLKPIDAKYHVVGGDDIYQAGKAANGNYVCSYFAGVAFLELPFFLIAHNSARALGFEADGFSPPYQYALVFGVLFYAFLGLFVLRKVLLYYFDDVTTALTLSLIILASNIIQYISIDSLQSHAFIFPLYAIVLFASHKWHEKPRLSYAILTGLICGLATLCRPTEAIIFLIPLLWNINTKENAALKWQAVRDNKTHLWAAIIVGLMVLSLQFIYYKYVSGSFLHVVGSRWVFLNPFFRVLFGFEKGWFIYTPVTILFVWGLFKMRSYPFNKSVIWFSLLNIWIIISWYDWQYGASYSTRALTQSYPVFALSLAALITFIRQKHKVLQYNFYALSIYLIAVNLFQLKQYDTTVLHYKDMNRQYYSRIYLNPNPNALDMSLLDTKDWLNTEGGCQSELVAHQDSLIQLNAQNNVIISNELNNEQLKTNTHYLKVEIEQTNQSSYWNCYFLTEIVSGQTVVNSSKIRLFNALTTDGKQNQYAYYIEIPHTSQKTVIRISVKTDNPPFNGIVNRLKIMHYWK